MSEFIDIITIIHSIHDKTLLENFLFGLTTARERQELIQRVEIVKRLLAGEAHHKIAADLRVGVATVTRGSKEIRKGNFLALRSSDENN